MIQEKERLRISGLLMEQIKHMKYNRLNTGILGLFIILSISMCSHNKKNSTGNSRYGTNDSILVTYYHGVIVTGVAIRCEDIAEIQQQHPQNRYGYSFPAGTPDELKDAYFEGDSVPDLEVKILPPELIDTFIVDNTVINRIVTLLDSCAEAPDFQEDARMYVTLKSRNGDCNYLCFDSFLYRFKYNGQSYSMNKELFFLLRYYSGYYSWFINSDLCWFEELKDTMFYKMALEQIRLKNL